MDKSALSPCSTNVTLSNRPKCDVTVRNNYIDGLQHKDITSVKPVFEKNRKNTKVVCPRFVNIRHLCFWYPHILWLLLRKITIFCNDVNKTSTSVELLAINIVYYMSKRSNVGLGIKSAAGLNTVVEEWNGHNTFVHLLKFDELLHFFVSITITISHFVQR